MSELTEPNVIYNLAESIELEGSKGRLLSQDEAYAFDMVNQFKSKFNIDDPLMTLSQAYLDDALKAELVTRQQKEDNYKPLDIREYCQISKVEPDQM